MRYNILTVCKCTIWLLLLASIPTYAQTEEGIPTGNTAEPLSVPIEIIESDAATHSIVEQDTIAIGDSLATGSAINGEKRNANKAILYSLIPGGGQLYNKQPVRAALFAGAVAGVGAFAIAKHIDYRNYKEDFDNLLLQSNYSNEEFAQLRDKKNDARTTANVATTALIVGYGFNILDAFVQTKLHNEVPSITHSPIKAAYRSAVVPGWGQVYNRKVWKVPLIYAGFAVGGYAIYANNEQYLKYRDELLARTRPNYGPLNDDLPEEYYSNDLIRLRRNNYRRLLDISIIGTSLWYIINVLDATIDGHLYDFDVSDDLSLKVSPTIIQNPLDAVDATAGLALQLRF